MSLEVDMPVLKWRLYNGHLQTTDHRPDERYVSTRCPFSTMSPFQHDHHPCRPETCPFGEIKEKHGSMVAVLKCSERDVELTLEEIVWDPSGPEYTLEG